MNESSKTNDPSNQHGQSNEPKNESENYKLGNNKLRKFNPKKFYGVPKPIPLTRRRKDFRFMYHECCNECSILERKLLEDNPTKFKVTDDSILMYDYGPFIVPLFLEFKRKNDEEDCGYLTPCGKEMYTYEDIYRYLKVSGSKLNINQFTLSARIELFRNHSYFKVYAMRRDISNGIETIPIQCINEIQAEFYPNFVYIKEREFAIDSELLKSLTKKDELKYCDCEDDCNDLNKCKCRQMTISENKPLNSVNNSGYEFNYLINQPKTAIYECNSKCKCKKNCLNRVVQNGIKCKLQIYKTRNRGWGVRTLHDIPKGTYICSYVGRIVKNLRTEAESENLYLMNLNYKHCYNYLKKNYEESGQKNLDDKDRLFQGVSNTGNTDLNDFNLNLDEKGFKEQNSVEENRKFITIHDLTDPIDFDSEESDTSFSDLTTTDLSESSLSEYEYEISNNKKTSDKPKDDLKNLKDDLENLNNDLNNEDANKINQIDIKEDKKVKDINESARKKFKKDLEEEPDQILDSDYLVDARDYGNLARFLNHSCNPNLESQPVFIETQNPLFPHFAFFARCDVKAFTELTINYYVAEGHIPIFRCKCKSKKCVSKSKQRALKKSQE